MILPVLKKCKLSFFFVSIVIVSACSTQSSIENQYLDKKNTLENIEPAVIPKMQSFDAVNIDDIVQSYRKVLERVNDENIQQDVLRRLAAIELFIAEKKQIEEEAPNSNELYKYVIQNYKELLSQQAGRADNDKLLYSLAKAYALSGQIDKELEILTTLVERFPESVYFQEAQFRRGEMLFSNKAYKEAAKAYLAVIHSNENSPSVNQQAFFDKAFYMLGWSQYKQEKYQDAIYSFIEVTDHHHSLAESAVAKQETDTSQKAKLQLLDDTYRVIALSFSNLREQYSLDDLLNDVGEKNYSDQLYLALGDLYLSKKRYIDSASVYGSYQNRYPLSLKSPEFKQREIDTYKKGGFSDRVRLAKEEYSKRYALDGEYINKLTSETFNETEGQKEGVLVAIKENLSVFIDELASYYHGKAQEMSKASSKKINQRIRKEFYIQAIYWYNVWIKSFPKDIEIGNKYFLLGECNFELGDFKSSIEAYEFSAYGLFAEQKAQFNHRNEAGYSALLAYDQYIEFLSVDDELLTQWQSKKIESALLFADNFPNDIRRTTVLAQSIHFLLNSSQYQRTIDVADQLIYVGENQQTADTVSTNRVETEYLFNAWLAKSHALFAMQEYSSAETAYQQSLSLLALDSQSQQYREYYKKTLENYAASIYRQGEVQLQSDNALDAAKTFLRVTQSAPESDVAASALYDASVIFMQQKSWLEAVDTINALKLNYPEKEASIVSEGRLLTAYENLENWSNAAIQADIIANQHIDLKTRKQALYISASYYEKAGDQKQAIAQYKDYANRYVVNADEQLLEVQSKLIMHDKNNRNSNYLYWSSKLVESGDSLSDRSQRANFLVAQASSYIANKEYENFNRIKLKAPIRNSLPKKREAMEKAIQQYNKTASYNVEEFSTLATQRIGQIYQDLASELMDSERPKGLSELELEQYEILLEEQAFPFEEKAIELHAVNIERFWSGARSDSIKKSFKSLEQLMPGRYRKPELRP